MSKAEWCANEESRALCGVSKKICLNLWFHLPGLRGEKVVSELDLKEGERGDPLLITRSTIGQKLLNESVFMIQVLE